MTISANARFFQKVTCLGGGQRPDARTRYEVSRVHVENCLPLESDNCLIALLQKLPWESRLFSRPCWNLYVGAHANDAPRLALATRVATQRGLIWTRVSSDHTVALRVLREGEFAPVAEMRNLRQRLTTTRLRPFKVDPRVRTAKPNDTPPLAKLAQEIFTNDRFHRDPKIPRRLADRAHAVWVRNAILGRVADETLVAVSDGRLAGFHSLKWLDTPAHRVGLTVLIGVGRGFQGQGLGTALLEAGLLRLWQRGAREVWIRTEAANAAANALYESFGFAETGRFWYLRRLNT